MIGAQGRTRYQKKNINSYEKSKKLISFAAIPAPRVVWNTILHNIDIGIATGIERKVWVESN